MKRTIVLTLTIAMSLILGACSSKGEIQTQSNAQSSTNSTTNESADASNTQTPNTSITDNKNIDGLVNEVDKAKEETSKDNTLTKEEMLKIGKELRENKVKQFYNVKNDEQLISFLDTFYFDDNQTRFDTFQKSYKENIDLYTSGVIVLSNESVEPYEETGFVYRAKGTETATKKDNTTESATYNITMNLDKDADGKYKITAETIE